MQYSMQQTGQIPNDPPVRGVLLLATIPVAKVTMCRFDTAAT